MKEIKFSFDRDKDDENSKEAEVIDLAEYREYIKEFFHEIDDEDNGGDDIQEYDEEYEDEYDGYDGYDGHDGRDGYDSRDGYGGDGDRDGMSPDEEETDRDPSEDEEDGGGDVSETDGSDGEEKRPAQAKKPKKQPPRDIKRASRQRRKSIAVKILAGIAILAAIGAVFLASPVFAVRVIEMNELQYFTKEEICSRIGLETGDNGVFFNKGRAEKLLENDKYISEADISFRFPDTMVITIDENRICGYINYLGNYLYIDREGRVIDVKSETQESLPIIEGLKFSSFTVGEVMQVQNEEAFEAALIISKAMSKYEVEGKAVSINVSNTDSIYAYVDNIKVLLGDTSRMEEKIKTMAEAVAEIPEGDMGTLDLQDLSKPIIFKYST